MNSRESTEPLSRVLSAWQVVPSRSPELRSRVFARLDTARAAPSWATYARAHVRLVAVAVVLASFAGAIGGRERARDRSAQESSRLANSYVQAMDARTMRMP
jgi:hypothetical protein